MHQEVDCSKPYGRGWEWNQSVDSFAQVLHNQAPLLTFERPRTLDAQTDFEAILYEPCVRLAMHVAMCSLYFRAAIAVVASIASRSDRFGRGGWAAARKKTHHRTGLFIALHAMRVLI